jgi:hypothetical protein
MAILGRAVLSNNSDDVAASLPLLVDVCRLAAPRMVRHLVTACSLNSHSRRAACVFLGRRKVAVLKEDRDMHF